MPEQTTPERTTTEEPTLQSGPEQPASGSAPEPTASERSGSEPAAATELGAEQSATTPGSPAADPATTGAEPSSAGVGGADSHPSRADVETEAHAQAQVKAQAQAKAEAPVAANDGLADGTHSGTTASGVADFSESGADVADPTDAVSGVGDFSESGSDVADLSEPVSDVAASTEVDASLDVARSRKADDDAGGVSGSSRSESASAATDSDPDLGDEDANDPPVASADGDESDDDSDVESDDSDDESGDTDGESDDDSPSGESLLVREGDFAGDYLERLLDILDLDGDIDLDVEGGRAVVDIVGGDLDSLVGPKGATLDALQELTRLTVAQETGVRTRLMLDIGGFRAGRRTELGDLATRTASKVLETGDTARLSPMNAFERKIVHDVVTATDGVRSESEGEDPQRRVVILREQ